MTGEMLRVLDANGNRAREAARFLEDVARFCLCSRGLAEEAKGVRHGVTGVVARVAGDGARLAAWRDTPGDVGTEIEGGGEMRRGTLRDAVGAAGGRLAEALRVIEELCKVAGGEAGEGAAREAERLRYRAYELAKRVGLGVWGGAGGGSGGGSRQWALCVLITEALCEHHPWERVAAEAMEGGAECVQLREKGLGDRELLRRARRLVALAREHDTAHGTRTHVVINDRADIALVAGADGVHVGEGDVSVEDVRRLGGGRLMVGVSTSAIEEALAALGAGADYCGVGPMFETATKEKPRIAGPGYLAEYLSHPRLAGLPHLAIGGITAERVGELARVGCRGVAVSGAVCKAQHPAVACRVLRNGLASTH